tara:strand:+ start:368 stop:628 length:261 start_codon:yes stop_codon:yes gene_type:complete
MSGNRFSRLPTTTLFQQTFEQAFNNATQAGQDAANLSFQNQLNEVNLNITQLAAAVEREFLKMSHKISEDDSISITDQIAWYMTGT